MPVNGPSKRIVKRTTDIFFSAAALVCLSPLMLLAALAVKLGSTGPVLYRGLRVGRAGKPFHILKFRTMIPRAEILGGSATAADDPRITRVGAFLRRYKLDELPQLFNVLRGQMSLVGPRPEVPRIVETYTARQKKVLQLRPGITDWASIWDIDEGGALRSHPEPENAYRMMILPTKLELQLLYLERQSWIEDLRILSHTFFRLIDRKWIPRQLAAVAPPKCDRT